MILPLSRQRAFTLLEVLVALAIFATVAAAVLTAAAAANDLAAIKAAAGDVGKACKACHEAYRGPEEE